MKDDIQECDCKQNCGIRCLNRMLFIECSPDKCKLGPSCSNNEIQKKRKPPIEVFETRKKGLGIRAKRFIEKNVFIIEYVGEVVSKNTFENRLRLDYNYYSHYYGMNFHKGFVIDSYKMGNESRFVNHSCSPNCEIQIWIVDGIPRICLFSKIDIEHGEELTFDYKFSRYNSQEIGQQCFCGSSVCSGTIGGRVFV